MTEIPYVKPDQLQTAREMEAEVLNLPSDLVSFVGVKVTPTLEEGTPHYEVVVGCPGTVDVRSCSMAIFFALRKTWAYELIDVRCFRGRGRSN